jgi:Ca2+-binding RTX toxin-like protein
LALPAKHGQYGVLTTSRVAMPGPTEVAPRTRLAGLDLADQGIDGPAARSTYGVNGAGIKIGILSDSYNVLGGAASDIAQGLLPSNGVTVLKEGPPGSTDEGRALAELIHATAPGAQLYFYSAYYSEQDFANGMLALAAAGCQVIVDDIAWEDEPFFQLAGPVDTAAQQVVAQGVNYFSAAGNEGTNFFQGAFTPAATFIPGVGTVTAEQFPGGSFYQTATIPAGANITLSLQWNAPYEAANPATLSLVAVAPDGSVVTSFQPNQEPAALLDFPVLAASQTYRIYVTQLPGTAAPGQFKDVLEGGGTLSGQGVGVGSGSIIGHELVPGVNAVGAVNIADTPAEGGTPTPEPYSSTGPGELLLSQNGTPLAQPQTLDAPAFLAPDGANTSVFAPFLGTSAAAAEAAATAALMLEADPALSNGDVSTLLADSAIPAGPASVAGAGLIRADVAVGYAATRQISASAQPVIRGISQPCTVLGGAGTHEIIAGSGPALLDSQGSDTVIAGAGADTVNLLGPAALLFGGSGKLLVGALDGSDTVVAGTGSATVMGGSGGGAEWGSPSGGDWLAAGEAPTWLVAGGSGDTLVAAGGGNDSLFAGGTGAATMLGGGAAAGNVFVIGGTGDHLILPGAGTNLVYLGGGADTVAGGSGRLIVAGGSGTPLVFGSTTGGNLLAAGSGAATLIGGGAGDLLLGHGAGDVLAAASSGNDTLIGGFGQESLVGGATGTNVFQAGAADAVIAPETADAVVMLGSGQSTVVAGSGNTVIDASAGTAGGTDFIVGFDPAHDMLRLAGYGGGAASALAAQYDTQGNTWLSLPDGTVIGFVGLAHLSAANVVTA